MNDPRAPQEAVRRRELAEFLRVRRADLQPEQVQLRGFELYGQRRARGLRREEVAELAGISTTWYTYLEQGRDVRPSDQVIEALARALRLLPDQHQHLRRLAGLSTLEPTTETNAVLPRLQVLVDNLLPNVASVYDRHLDYLAWNAAYVKVRLNPGLMPDARRNLLWMMFMDKANRACMTRWEPAARRVLSQFRAISARHPGDQRSAEIIAALNGASPEFAEWWGDYPVGHFTPATIGIDHPTAGELSFEMFQFHPVEHPDLLLVLQVPATPEDLRRVRALLS
jgi:transcriptional regulator with XRE-family HTH domain